MKRTACGAWEVLCVAIQGSYRPCQQVSKYPQQSNPTPRSTSGLPQEMEYRLPEAYHKILDYHVAEILLSTIVLAAIAFLRLHLHH